MWGRSGVRAGGVGPPVPPRPPPTEVGEPPRGGERGRGGGGGVAVRSFLQSVPEGAALGGPRSRGLRGIGTPTSGGCGDTEVGGGASPPRWRAAPFRGPLTPAPPLRPAARG